MNGNYNLQVELGSQKATDSVILNKFSESAVADLVQFDGSKPLDKDDGVITTCISQAKSLTTLIQI